MTIYKKTSNWVPQGNLVTKTFPSGLVLLQQDYVAATGTPPSPDLAIGEPFPGSTASCMDGAFIFPAPGYQDNNNGFTTCTVTAYGRNSASGNKTLTKTLSEHKILFGIKYVTDPAIEAVANERTIDTISDQLIWSFVIPKSENPNLICTDPTNIYHAGGDPLSPLYLSEFLNLQGYNLQVAQTIISKTALNKLARADCTNFGYFDEWKVVYNAKFSDPDFQFGLLRKIQAPSSEDKDFTIELSHSTFGTIRVINEFELFDFEPNFSEFPEILKVWNVASLSPSSARQEMFENTNNTTLLGGTLRRNVVTSQEPSTAYFVPPQNLIPPDVHQQYGVQPPPQITTGAFTWVPELINSDYNLGDTYIYKLLNDEIYERFEVELGNELGQTSTYRISIKFKNPE